MTKHWKFKAGDLLYRKYELFIADQRVSEVKHYLVVSVSHPVNRADGLYKVIDLQRGKVEQVNQQWIEGSCILYSEC